MSTLETRADGPLSSTLRFYESLPTFDRFSEVVESRHYQRVPSDWLVVLTDVKGSTQAIAENRYKEVNMVGASSIIAVLNALKGRDIPFIFGGDGATMLVHESDFETVKSALLATQRVSRETFGLEIRVGAVPIAHLEDQGAVVDVAKYRVSEFAALAMVRGGGLALAEKWIKAADSSAKYSSHAPATPSHEASFDGLSCRWNPVKAHRGEMLSMLVLATGTQAEMDATYRDVLLRVESILGEDPVSRPITVDKLDGRFRFRNLRTEIRLRGRSKGRLGRFWIGVRVVAAALFTFGTYRLHLKTAFFDPDKYARDLASSTDYRKFDDMLRMARDCDPTQRRAIESYLEDLRRQRRIVYGLHGSGEALMTCLVFSMSHHVHFVDGSNGGYAIAAKQLKQQLLAVARQTAS